MCDMDVRQPGFNANRTVVVETDRLIIRHFHVSDSEAMDRVFSDEEVMRYGIGVQTRRSDGLHSRRLRAGEAG